MSAIHEQQEADLLYQKKHFFLKYIFAKSTLPYGYIK